MLYLDVTTKSEYLCDLIQIEHGRVPVLVIRGLRMIILLSNCCLMYGSQAFYNQCFMVKM